jgi:hypothetical protein
MSSDTPLVRVRPRRSVLVTAIVSLAAALVPVTVMLAFLASASGSWVTAAIVELAVIVVCVVLGMRQLSLFAQVTPTALEGNGFMTPTVSVPLDRIAAVHLVDTWVGQSAEVVTQLLVVDADGRRLFRLRGNFWPDGSLDTVAAALPVPPTRGEEPVSVSRFFADYPSSEYWFENKPWLKVAAIAVGSAGAVGIALWIMTVIGQSA